MKILLLTLICIQCCFAQQNTERNNVVQVDTTEVTRLNGLKYAGGIEFFIGKDKQTILAKQNGKTLWVKNIVKMCGKPLVGKPKIRETWLKENSLMLVYGKHSFAKINIVSGHETCLGSD